MLRDSDLVSIQEVRAKVEKAYAAFQLYRKFSQDQIDSIVESMAAAARLNAARLGTLAVEETTYGNAKDKLAKNLLAADLLPRRLRGMKTIGILRELPEEKIIEIGVPVGVVAAILPTTNPTSTAIYKVIIALKAGNAVVVSPHPRAKACSCETVKVLSEAAIAVGAPQDLIQCVFNATMEGTDELMRHPRTSVILATGGSGIVKAAYSSGKPAYGVGPGNVPVLLDASADKAEAVAKVVQGKSFDYGTLCSSEQSLVGIINDRNVILDELRKNKAHLCTPDQGKALAKLLITPNWRIDPNCVGQAPTKIARMAGFDVPADTSILAVEIEGVGKQYPLSMEKLSPVLSLLFVKDWDEQIKTCHAILKFGGLGHTCVIHARDDARVREYGLRMPAFRVLVNTPSPQGSTGITTGVQPAMTLGCGAMAGNATSDNVGPQHLMNIKRVAYVVRKAEEAFSTENNETTKGMVVSAVEKYLAQRGYAGQGSPGDVALVVDRFLARKGVGTGTSLPPASSAASSSCGCSIPGPVGVTAAVPVPDPPPPPAPRPSPVEIVDFVCEADVRAAVNQGKKIYIGPKTIVTPAAREFGNQHDILVQAQRS